MPPKKAGPAAKEVVQIKIMSSINAKCTHGSYAIICADCKAEQDAVDMFLI